MIKAEKTHLPASAITPAPRDEAFSARDLVCTGGQWAGHLDIVRHNACPPATHASVLISPTSIRLDHETNKLRALFWINTGCPARNLQPRRTESIGTTSRTGLDSIAGLYDYAPRNQAGCTG